MSNSVFKETKRPLSYDKADVYAEKVEPKLKEIQKLCDELDIDFVAVCQFGRDDQPDGVGYNVGIIANVNELMAHPIFTFARVALSEKMPEMMRHVLDAINDANISRLTEYQDDEKDKENGPKLH